MNTENCNKSEIHDYGDEPVVLNMNRLTNLNTNYRTALWTGHHLQVTLMCLLPGEDIGLEMHQNVDQFLMIEHGQGIVRMGNCKDKLNIQKNLECGCAVIVPCGTWHNIKNVGNSPMKIYSIYAPVQHPYGTVQRTKAIAKANERY